MTLIEETAAAKSTADPTTEAPPGRGRATRFLGRYGWIAIAVLVLAWLLVNIPVKFIPLDPALTFMQFRPGFPLHYPLLVVHVFAGVVALVTACLQIWPWLRREHPAAHRFSGRAYVFAGALPSALSLFLLLPLRMSVDGPQSVQTVMFLSAGAWLTTTVLGYRAGRRRRWAEHRKWMTYSVALAMGVLWPGLVIMALFGKVDLVLLRDVVAWAPWALTVGVAHLWLKRTARRAGARG